MRTIIAATTMSAMLAGCTIIPTSSPPAPQAQCSDSRLGTFTGQKATAETGTQMLALAHAKTLRWAPPNSAMTMDFRADRLTVAYDQAMTIISARCG